MEVSGRKSTGSEAPPEVVLNVCDACESNRSISRAAFGYCLECKEFMCTDCYHGHRNPKPCRKHTLLSGKRMPKKTLRPVDICHKHADEEINFFCIVHSALACHKCAFLDHRLCSEVCDISTLSSMSTNDQRYKEVIKNIAFLETRAEKERQTRLDNLSKIDANKKQAKADIKAFCKAMHEQLYKIEHTADKEVDMTAEEDIKNMDKILKECDAVNTGLNVITADLETNQNPNRKDQLFIAIQKALITTKTLDHNLTTLNNDNIVREYIFEPDDRFRDIMIGVKKLGSLSIRTVAPSLNQGNNEESPASNPDRTSASDKTDQTILPSKKSLSLPALPGGMKWNSKPVVIELWKGDSELGFSIVDYQDPVNPCESVIVIESLRQGGVAETDGQLGPRDKLIFVNDVNVERASLDEAVQAFKKIQNESVKIAVAKPLTRTKSRVLSILGLKPGK